MEDLKMDSSVTASVAIQMNKGWVQVHGVHVASYCFSLVLCRSV